MAVSKNRKFAQIANDVAADGTLTAAAISSDVTLGGATTYSTRANLPTSGNTAGDQAYVSEDNRLYIWNGSGWYKIAIINATPTFVSITDSNGGTTPFALSTDGTPTTITLLGQDSDAGDSLTYSYVTDNAFNNMATITGSGSTYTITPFSEDSATATSGTVTFKVSDGASFAVDINTFTLEFNIPAVFNISPAVNSISTWEIENDGALELSSTGTWDITPTVNCAISVKMWGAGGGSGSQNISGGGGGFSEGNVNLLAGITYKLFVGQGGRQGGQGNAAGGGGSADQYRGGGGGYSGIFVTSISQGNAYLMAGGGGGAGGGTGAGPGGAGGGTTGGVTNSGYAPGGGTQIAGGQGDGSNSSADGSALTGANGLSGGGGGYYGGGSGGDRGSYAPAGGGGSGYINTTQVTNGNTVTGNLDTVANSSDANRGTAGNPATSNGNGIDGKIYIYQQ